MTSIVEYNEDNFSNFERYEGVAMIGFYAPWCESCGLLNLRLQQLAAQFDDVKFGQVNVDQAPIVTLRYNVYGLPTVLLFKNGVIIERIAGLQFLARYAKALRTALADE